MSATTPDFKWVEAWIDSSTVSYCLLVRETWHRAIQIVDPQKAHSVVETFAAYEDALHWLNEDEYDLMDGRYAVE